MGRDEDGVGLPSSQRGIGPADGLGCCGGDSRVRADPTLVESATSPAGFAGILILRAKRAGRLSEAVRLRRQIYMRAKRDGRVGLPQAESRVFPCKRETL